MTEFQMNPTGHRHHDADTLENFSAIVQSIVDRNNELVSQNQIMIKLLTDLSSKLDKRDDSSVADDQATLHLSERQQSFDPPDNLQQTSLEIWSAILKSRSINSNEFMEAYHSWLRPATIQAVLNEKKEWTSWSYEAAFPELAKFLKKASLSRRYRAQLYLRDYDGKGQDPDLFRYNESQSKSHVLWERIKRRPYSAKASTFSTVSAVRLLQVIDLSPTVLSCILAATPR
jgi:hypothetical protein